METVEHSLLFWTFNITVVVLMSALTIYSARIWKGSGKYLCDDCRFNNPEACLKVERPMAVECTSYRACTTSDTKVIPDQSVSTIALQNGTKAVEPVRETGGG